MKGCKYIFIFLFLLVSNCSFSQEICNNGKDDDGDGLIDLQDPDCQCHFNVSGNLLQNGSFELYKNCPTNYSYNNDYNIANFWQYGTYTSINVAEYYHNFNCSYDSSQVMLYLPPALPLPDGTAFMSIRQYVYRKPDMTEKDIAKVYISQCLQNPLTPGKQYTLSFSAGRFKSPDDHDFKFKEEPFTVAVFGHPDCNAVPFGPVNASSNGCPTNFSGWVLLGKTTLRSKGKWVQDKINFTVPENINVLEIGPDCSNLESIIDQADSTTFLDYYVYDIDDLHLLPTQDFHFQYIQSLGEIESQNTCGIDSLLSVPFYSNASYQWYKDSIAIIGATSNNYRLPAENPDGNYNVLISNTDSCLVSEPFTVLTNPLGNLSLPADTSLCESDSLLLAPPLAGVTYSWNGNNYQSVKIFNPGVYQITASAANGCFKTYTVNVHSQNCSTFMPNAFTPNGDGINDLFRIPQDVKITINDFSIFDRWGNKVFSTHKRSDAWDGNYKGKKSAEGTYIYIISGNTGNKEIRIKGLVTLIR
ncbi:MAG: gliding motility-associated C-terminal domain-containing protein [Bacteroidota bacterium]|nr:gliding motility-associated C-terminal domain-containing protein [Bacteroidota bacterium]